MSPRKFTPAEVRAHFLDHLACMIEYWAKINRPEFATEEQRMSGLIHSILCALDGVSAGFPACDVIARPHPDDKAFRKADGCDYYDPDGTALHGGGTHGGDVMLHEEWRKHDRWPAKARTT